MNILVTGGAGFIGSNLIKRLIKEEHAVTCIDNFSTGNKSNLHSDCLNLKGDLAKPLEDSFNYNKFENLLEDLIENTEVVIHLASLARIQPSLKEPSKILKNNINAFIEAIELAKISKAKFVYASSSSITKGIFLSPYAYTQFVGEQLSSLYEGIYKVNTVGARFFNVYGPGQCEEGENATVIGIFEKAMKEGKPLPIVGDGTQKRDFIHIDDIVDGIIRMATMKTKIGMLYELGSNKSFSINEIADMFGGEKIYIPKREGEYALTLSSSNQIQNQLGWRAKKNLKTYINNLSFPKY